MDGTKINWSASVGPRLGYIIKNDFLIYGTTGAAMAGIKTTNYTAMDKAIDSKLGYFVGVGVDYKINPNWIAGLNYRFSDFGDTFVDAIGVTPFSTHNKLDEISLGLSYKF